MDNDATQPNSQEPRELNPVVMNSPVAFGNRDFKITVRPAGESDETEEVEADPKDSSAQESADSSTETPKGPPPASPEGSPEPEKTVSAEKVSGKPKAPEAGVPSSSPAK